jgi:hypothetical protein
VDALYIVWCTAEVDALARWGWGLVLALGLHASTVLNTGRLTNLQASVSGFNYREGVYLAVRRRVRWDGAREVVMLVVTCSG